MGRLRIDVFADIACPWCYIGEKRLGKALAAFPGLEVDWHWHPFQLEPQFPPEGIPWADFVDSHFDDQETARRTLDYLKALGAQDGIGFAFEKLRTAPNTAEAHRLVLFAQEFGRERETALGLFRAFFEEGGNLGDRSVLIDVGRRAGLDPEAALDWLESGRGADDVEDSGWGAQRLGIDGVPVYIFNQRYAVSGAQPVTVFQQAVEKAIGA